MDIGGSQQNELFNDVVLIAARDPGLKPLQFIGLFQGAEAPCSLRNAEARAGADTEILASPE